LLININADSDSDSDDDSSSSVDEHVYQLYQHDFTDGTYRIRSPGTYLIMEDITFDFAGGADAWESPNSDYNWWPNPSKNNDDEYPGADDVRGEYFMGFFAGITIETNDVVLDLQGYTLAQSLAFYYQQRYFFVISLKSVIFNLNNGPGMFGAQPAYASNCIIRNGVIGLSSHMGIHGHKNEDILIENIHVRHFETHGIEMSDFNSVTYGLSRCNFFEQKPRSSKQLIFLVFENGVTFFVSHTKTKQSCLCTNF
jgi:hypothetical protein